MPNTGLVVHTVFSREQAKGLGKCPVGKLSGGLIGGRDKSDLSVHLKCDLDDGWFTMAFKDTDKRWVVSHDAKKPNKPEIRFKRNCACIFSEDGTKLCGLFAYSKVNGLSEKQLVKKFGKTYVIEGHCPTP
jgi:hypothetical protein